jgi:hypothetical protein
VRNFVQIGVAGYIAPIGFYSSFRRAFQKGIEVPYKVDRSTTTEKQARERGKNILI